MMDLPLLYWRRNLGKSGQSWDYKNRVRTLGEMARLHNCAVAGKGSIDEYYRDLDKAGITKIAYDFGRYRTTAQLCSCRHNATAVA